MELQMPRVPSLVPIVDLSANNRDTLQFCNVAPSRIAQQPGKTLKKFFQRGRDTSFTPTITSAPNGDVSSFHYYYKSLKSNSGPSFVISPVMRISFEVSR